MTLRAVLPLLLVVLVVASAAPLWSANDRRRQRPGLARGGLHLVASKRGAILSGRNLAPGDRVTGAVTIANRGTLPGSFTLSGKVRGSRPMAANLVLTIRPRQARRFRLIVSFRGSAPNALQGRRVTASFTWRAVQRS
jgi:hypothetical protein